MRFTLIEYYTKIRPARVEYNATSVNNEVLYPRDGGSQRFAGIVETMTRFRKSPCKRMGMPLQVECVWPVSAPERLHCVCCLNREVVLPHRYVATSQGTANIR